MQTELSNAIAPWPCRETSEPAMGAAACRKRRSCFLLAAYVVLVTAVATVAATGRGVSSSRSIQQLDGLVQQQQHVEHNTSTLGFFVGQSRHLLQSSYVSTVCDASSSVNDAAVKEYASKLLGDNRLAVTAARFSGACNAFGLSTLSTPHVLANQLGGALVLSTGDAAAAVADLNSPSQLLSTDLKQAGDASIGSYTYDAAVLEIDISVAPSSSSDGSSNSSELVLSYLFASEEYGTSNPNPDALSITAKASSGSQYTDVAILPGGRKIPPPSAFMNDLPIDVYKNTELQYRTALNGFTQVVPTQGFPVQSGGSYTLRISTADANNGLVDSVVLLPVGGLKLLASPVIASGGPYAVAPNSQLILSAAKSKSDNGAILAYQWKISPYNSTDAPLATAAGPTVALSAPPIGRYNITLDVWDVLGGHAQESTVLSVDASNVLDWWSATPSFATPPPVAVPKPAAVIAINGTITNTLSVNARSDGNAAVQFDASQSTDGRGSKLAYAWRVTQMQPAPVTPVALMLGYNQPASFVHSFAPGVYLIDLDVSGPGGTGSTQSLLTVNANSPPVASAGGPYSTAIGVPVVVSAAKSSDPDGDPLTYSWVLYKGAQPIANYSGQTLSMQLNTAGTYNLKLTVTDGRGGTASATTQITSYASLPASSAATEALYSTASVPQTTTTVIAALPAPAPATSSSALRLADTSTTSATATAAPAYTQSVYTPTPAAATTPAGVVLPTTSSSSAAPTMCLYTRNSTSSSTNPLTAFLSNLNLFGLTNTYWAPCSQGSTAAAPVSGSSTISVPANVSDPLASKAVIRSPEAFVTATGPATQVYLDASGSTAASGRSLIAFAWTVKQKSSGAVVTQVAGLRTPVWLGPGVYVLQLVVTDTSGQTATASREFSIGDVAETLAYISSPGSFVENLDANAVDVQLSAAGSKGGPGRSLTNYRWAVYRLPDNAQLTSQEGPTATVALPVGSYRVYLAMFDSGGGNATTYKDFVVGGRDVSGVMAVITWPPPLVQAATDSSTTTVALDASGSMAAGNDSTISQYIWAVVSMPGKQPVANATGRLTVINLPVGYYQVGLLIIDSQGNSGAARKNFAISGTPANVNNIPVVNGGLAFAGTAGGSFEITGVADPDGDSLTITWALMNQATGSTVQGKGQTVSLKGQTPGKYLLLITANDGRGGESSSTAVVAVTSADAAGSTIGTTVPSSGNSSSGSRLSAPPPAPASTSSSSSSSAAGAAGIRKLPTVTLPRGATMVLDAASFDLLPADVKLDAYVWELKQHSSGENVATVYGRIGHFEMSIIDTFDIKLIAYDTKGTEYVSAGTAKVVSPGAGISEVNDGVMFTGKCGPFVGKQYTAVLLSCPSLTVAGVPADLLHFAWKITTPTGAVQTQSGKKPSFIGLGPGHFKVELAISTSGSPAASHNTAYYLVTYLTVKSNNRLQLRLPASMCYGQAVSLTAPPLVQEGGVEPEFEWEVIWVESQKLLGYKQVMQGEGRTFGFTLQTGHYEVVMNATMASGDVIQGTGNITALPCLNCRSGVVPVKYAAGKCTADNSLTRQVLLNPIPEGVLITWASGTVTSPGVRKVSIVSKSVTAGLGASCSATVNFTDAEPPTMKLLNATGICMTPPNNRWSCWQANQLVRLRDNCQAHAALAYVIQCSEGSAADCRVLPDGRACVKAAAEQMLKLRVLARDGFGNIAQAKVPVQVRAVGPTAVGCQIPKLRSPEAAAAVR